MAPVTTGTVTIPIFGGMTQALVLLSADGHGTTSRLITLNP
jgi:hypothetical protein